MTGYRVEHLYMDGWGDAGWTADGRPLTFDTPESAQAEIDDMRLVPWDSGIYRVVPEGEVLTRPDPPAPAAPTVALGAWGALDRIRHGIERLSHTLECSIHDHRATCNCLRGDALAEVESAIETMAATDHDTPAHAEATP